MRLRRYLAAVWLLTRVAPEAWAQASPPVSAAGVQVQVTVDSTGHARVLERYRIPRDTGRMQLQLLQRACATVSVVTLSTYADTFVLASTVNGPWVTLRDTTASGQAHNADSSGFDVSYTVSPGAPSVDVPVVQLTRAIPRLEGEREGGVSLSVATDGEVLFPRLSRRAPGQPWVGRFVAIPSFVRIAQTRGATPVAGCASEVASDSSDGGLTWRFWTLVGIMLAWVPLYLTWARRAQSGGGDA